MLLTCIQSRDDPWLQGEGGCPSSNDAQGGGASDNSDEESEGDTLPTHEFGL